METFEYFNTCIERVIIPVEELVWSLPSSWLMLRSAITEPGVQPKWTEKDKIPSQPKSKAALGHVPLPPDPCGVERVDRGDTAAAWIALCILNLILIEPTGPELELCLDYKLWLTMVSNWGTNRSPFPSQGHWGCFYLQSFESNFSTENGDGTRPSWQPIA